MASPSSFGPVTVKATLMAVSTTDSISRERSGLIRVAIGGRSQLAFSEVVIGGGLPIQPRDSIWSRVATRSPEAGVGVVMLPAPCSAGN